MNTDGNPRGLTREQAFEEWLQAHDSYAAREGRFDPRELFYAGWDAREAEVPTWGDTCQECNGTGRT